MHKLKNSLYLNWCFCLMIMCLFVEFHVLGIVCLVRCFECTEKLRWKNFRYHLGIYRNSWLWFLASWIFPHPGPCLGAQCMHDFIKTTISWCWHIFWPGLYLFYVWSWYPCFLPWFLILFFRILTSNFFPPNMLHVCFVDIFCRVWMQRRRPNVWIVKTEAFEYFFVGFWLALGCC